MKGVIMIREFNEYKITLLFRADGNTGDELDINIPKTYAEGVYVRQTKETALDHVRSKIVHCTKADHVKLNTINVPHGYAVLEPTGYLSDSQFNPILVGINREYATISDMLNNSHLDATHDIGTLVMVMDASTGDPTVVKSGWATYRFDGGESSVFTNWTKLAEKESIEFSFSWNDLGAPFKSTKEIIDRLGQEGHKHENLETLNTLSEKLEYLYYNTIKLRRREEIAAYKVTENLMSNDLFPGDMVYYVTGNRENPKLDPNGNPIGHGKESYPTMAQVISPETLTLSGNCSFYYKGNETLVVAPKIKTGHISHMEGFFYGCRELVYVPWYDTSDTVTMKEMFKDCYSIADIPTFEMGNVKDTTRMFSGCESLKSVPRTNLLNLVKASEMFKDCRTLTRLPDFSTPLLEECSSMFSGCSNLKSAPDINVSKCKNTISLFENCTYLEDCGPLQTISSEYMMNMFKNCHNLRYIGSLDFSSCKDASGIFDGCEKLEHITIRPGSLKCDLSFRGTNLDIESAKKIIMELTPAVRTLDISGTPAARELDASYIEHASTLGWTIFR